MRREEMADLAAFVVVAEKRNITRAAARLGISQSALSQIVRRLEMRLGLRLLARTTRSVAATRAGEHLVRTLAPMLHDLDRSIADLSELRDRSTGMIRITTVEHVAKTILLPCGPQDAGRPSYSFAPSARTNATKALAAAGSCRRLG